MLDGKAPVIAQSPPHRTHREPARMSGGLCHGRGQWAGGLGRQRAREALRAGSRSLSSTPVVYLLALQPSRGRRGCPQFSVELQVFCNPHFPQPLPAAISRERNAPKECQ